MSTNPNADFAAPRRDRRDDRPANVTIIKEGGSGGHFGLVMALISVLALGFAAYVVFSGGGEETRVEAAVTEASQQVGVAADKVGEAANNVGAAAGQAVDAIE